MQQCISDTQDSI